jgi:outer membrane protein TolC
VAYGLPALLGVSAVAMLLANTALRERVRSIIGRDAKLPTAHVAREANASANVPLPRSASAIEAVPPRRGEVVRVAAVDAQRLVAKPQSAVRFPNSATPSSDAVVPVAAAAPALESQSFIPSAGGPALIAADVGRPAVLGPIEPPSSPVPSFAVPAASEPLPAPISHDSVPSSLAPAAVAPPATVPNVPELPPVVEGPPHTEWRDPASAPLVAPPIGRFTAQGTISLADVRQMALRNNKDIAVFENLPRIAGASIESEAAVFDPIVNLALQGGRYHRQVATQIQSLGSTSPVLKTSFWQPANGLNQVYVEKMFVSGGKVQFGLGQNYINYSPAGDFVLINPAFQASTNLLLEQPLFKGRGAVATMAPMRIAKANQQQSWHAFRATVNQVLRDAEMAYWEAYAAFQDFETRDAALVQALQTVDREQGRLRLGEGSIPDVAQAEEQCEMFRIGRAEAETRLANAQRNLRRLMGIPADDPRPIIPATAPLDAPLEVDLAHACAEAHNRPEFAAQQAAVQAAEIELARRRNGLLPDLSARAIYSITGLDNNIDQAWSTVGTAHYNDWTAGVVYRQALGRRNDRALLARANSALALETARLQQIEHELSHQLNTAYQNVQAAQRLLQMHGRRRQAAALQLEARRELYLENRAALRDQLDAELRYASALYDESLARVNYQRALTDWGFARGTLVDGEFLVGQ